LHPFSLADFSISERKVETGVFVFLAIPAFFFIVFRSPDFPPDFVPTVNSLIQFFRDPANGPVVPFHPFVEFAEPYRDIPFNPFDLGEYFSDSSRLVYEIGTDGL